MANHHPYAILRQMRQMAGENHPDLLLDRQLIDRFLCATARFLHSTSCISDIVRWCFASVGAFFATATLRRTLPKPRFSCWSERPHPSRNTKRCQAGFTESPFALRCALAADAGKSLGRIASVSPKRELDPAGEASHRELCAILDEEMLRLPERFRTPVLLCYVEGQRAINRAATRLVASHPPTPVGARPRVVAPALDPSWRNAVAALLAAISLNPEPKPA